jgi:alpha-glucosidase
VLGNHDQHRLATRVGPAQARVAQMLLLTLRGTPTCYYGDEIGMQDVPIPFDECMDPAALQQPALFEIWGRDPERTPMQWDGSPNAGFTPAGIKPWLPLAANYQERNVALQELDPRSMLRLFRALAAARRAEPALNRGSFALVETGGDDVLAYRREDAEGDGFLVVLNFGKTARSLDLTSAVGQRRPVVVLSTAMDRDGTIDPAQVALRPDEGLLLRLRG